MASQRWLVGKANTKRRIGAGRRCQPVGLQACEQFIAPRFQRIDAQVKGRRLVQAVRQGFQFLHRKTPDEDFIQPVWQIKPDSWWQCIELDRLGLRQPFRFGFTEETVEFAPVHPQPAS